MFHGPREIVINHNSVPNGNRTLKKSRCIIKIWLDIKWIAIMGLLGFNDFFFMLIYMILKLLYLLTIILLKNKT